MKSTLLTLLLSTLPLAAADRLWYIDFNSEGDGPAPQTLVMASPSETSAAGPVRMAADAEAGRMHIVPSDGPEGGLALELRPGGAQNGAGYLCTVRSGKLQGNTFTYEALVCPAENPEPFNAKWGGQQILNQQPGGSAPQFWLSYNGEGTAIFSSTAGANLSGPVIPGKWSHLAGVVTMAEEEGGPCTLKFYINGELVGEKEFKRPASALPSSLGIGRYLQNKGDSFQGKIDAIAISPEALAPGSFALPLPR